MILYKTCKMQHLTRRIARQIANQTCIRMLTSKPNAPSSCGTRINDNVLGLSKNCVDVPNTPVGGPGASKDKEYKNPEYFCYHLESFAEAEVEMAKFRLPVPSNKKEFKQ